MEPTEGCHLPDVIQRNFSLKVLFNEPESALDAWIQWRFVVSRWLGQILDDRDSQCAADVFQEG
jgi:hypothetical protein